jgi:hypothetical protein
MLKFSCRIEGATPIADDAGERPVVTAGATSLPSRRKEYTGT